ncbi:hypothetical protein SprV_0401711000 [Sparganum proliferum]
MRPKAPLSRGETANVVYRVQCSSCQANYVGETGKRLQTRMSDHAKAVRRMDQLSLVAEHCAASGHTFDFQDAEILGRDPSETLVHNLSSKELRPVQLQVLQHAACFNTADADPVNLLARIESVLKHSQEPDDAKHLIRQQVTSLLLAHKPRVAIPKAEQDALERLKADRSVVVLPADKGRSTVVLDKSDYLRKANALLDDRLAYLRPRQTISSAEVKASKELKRDEEAVIVPADKGRTTVILDKSEYVAKAQELLNDNQSYKVINSDPMKTLVANINKSSSLMRNQQGISENDWRQMKPQYAAIAGFHGLPKTHKPNVPLRLIVEMKGPPTYGLD